MADLHGASGGAAPPRHQGAGAEVLVVLDLLVVPDDEAALGQAVHDSVAAVAGTATLGPVRWGEADDGEDLVHQWHVEQDGAPLDGRRVRCLTMRVRADGIGERVEEITWAAVDAVCPTAREEHRLLDAGQAPVLAIPDRYPWSSRTHVVGQDGG